MLPEENIVSEEEKCVEPENIDYNDCEDEKGIKTEHEEVTASALGDVGVVATGNARRRRTNAEAGVEITHMDFSGKGLRENCQFNFATNGKAVRRISNAQDKHSTCMGIACDTPFT